MAFTPPNSSATPRFLYLAPGLIITSNVSVGARSIAVDLHLPGVMVVLTWATAVGVTDVAMATSTVLAGAPDVGPR